MAISALFNRDDWLKRRTIGVIGRMAAFLPQRAAEPLLAVTADWTLKHTLAVGSRSLVFYTRRSQQFLANEEFDRDLARWLATAVEPGARCMDVGAHIGRFTLLMAALAGPTGSVDAVEPVAENCSLLRRNLAANGITTVTVHEKCGAAQPGEVVMHRGPTSFQWSTTRERGLGSIRVPALTLDSLREGGKRIDLIKVDVEGTEGTLLEGATTILRVDRPRWVVELHTPHGAPAVRLFREHGYHPTDLAGTPLDWHELSARAGQAGGDTFHVVFLP